MNFNLLSEAVITTFHPYTCIDCLPFAPPEPLFPCSLCWSPRAGSSTSLGSVLLGFQLRLACEEEAQTRREENEVSIFTPQYICSPWKVTLGCLLPSWEVTTPLQVASSKWLILLCSGNLLPPLALSLGILIAL